jgi:Ser/Thr protein kinase RdoA (MazF antagonist)
VQLGERLTGGYANDLFRVRADGEQLVLRVKLGAADPDDVAWEQALARELAGRLPFVHAPRAAFDVDGRSAWLVPFVDAGPADPVRDRLAVAAAVGRLHAAGAQLDLGPRPGYVPLRELAWPPAHDVLGDVTAEREAAIAVVREAAARRPRTGIVHGDLFPGNVLADGAGAVAAVIDWDEAQHDWLVWDLAMAVGTFCADEDAGPLDRDAVRAFVAAYREAGGPVPPEEDELLVPLVRVKRVLEVLRAPDDREPRWDHQRRNLASLAGLRQP